MGERLKGERGVEKGPERGESATPPRPWEEATITEVRAVLEDKGITEGTVCYCKGEQGLVRITTMQGAGEDKNQVHVGVTRNSNTPNEWQQSWPIREFMRSEPRPATAEEIAAAENGTLPPVEPSEAKRQDAIKSDDQAAANRATYDANTAGRDQTIRDDLGLDWGEGGM